MKTKDSTLYVSQSPKESAYYAKLIGLNLKENRIAQGLNRFQTAQRAGLRYDTIKGLEEGKGTIKNLLKYCDVIGLKPDKDNSLELGKMLQEKRISMGMKTYHATLRTGMRSETIQGLEEGKGTIDSLCKYSAALGINIEDYLTGKQMQYKSLQYKIHENTFYDNGFPYPDDYSVSFDSGTELMKYLTQEEIDFIAISHGGNFYKEKKQGNHIGGNGFVTAGYARDFADDVVSLYNHRVAEKQYNIDIQKQIERKLPPGYIFNMGTPSNKLLACGIPELPIRLNAARLKMDSNDPRHRYDLSEVKGLVNALNNPVAVFEYDKKNAARNVIVNIEHKGKNFLIGMFLNPNVDEKYLEINSIRKVLPKDTKELALWIQQGKLLGGDKQKIQTEIDKQRMTLADVEYLDMDLVAKIIGKGGYTKFSSNKYDNLIKKLQVTPEISSKEISPVQGKLPELSDREKSLLIGEFGDTLNTFAKIASEPEEAENDIAEEDEQTRSRGMHR